MLGTFIFSGNSMNNLLSYCGLTDLRMRASEKDLPVQNTIFIFIYILKKIKSLDLVDFGTIHSGA